MDLLEALELLCNDGASDSVSETLLSAGRGTAASALRSPALASHCLAIEQSGRPKCVLHLSQSVIRNGF